MVHIDIGIYTVAAIVFDDFPTIHDCDGICKWKSKTMNRTEIDGEDASCEFLPIIIE